MKSLIEKLRAELDDARRLLSETGDRQAADDAGFRAADAALATVQKNVELALHEWMSALDAVRDPIFMHDAEFRVMRCNLAYQKCAGMPFKDIIGKPFFEVFPKRDGPLPSCLRAAEHLPESGEDSDIVLVGDLIYRSRSFSIDEEEGVPRYALHILEEITEDVRSVEAIRSSRDLLRSVMENIPVRVFWKDRESRYMGCNSLFARDSGLSSPDELVGKNDFDMGWRDQAEMYRADDAQVIASGQAKLGFEEPQTTPDGRTIWLRTSKVPLPGPDGNTVGLLGIYEDVTADKEAEAALRRSEIQARENAQKFHGIASTAIDAIVMIDHLGRVTYWNPAAAQMFGYDVDEIIGRNLHDVLAPARYLEDHKAAFGNFAATGTGAMIGKTVELEAVRKDGTEFPIALSVSALQLGGGGTRLVWCAT